MLIVTLVLSVGSLILHVVAPRTKTKVDDVIRDGVDVVKGSLPKSSGVSTASQSVRVNPPPADTRDHRGGTSVTKS